MPSAPTTQQGIAVSEDSFFARWSQRKQQARDAAAPAGVEAPPEPVDGARKGGDLAINSEAARGHHDSRKPLNSIENGGAADTAQPPAPTLQDVEGLGKDSDFSRFAQRDVAPDVRNAAMKKLFADPHFNVMDGLDVYIDDYSQGETIPKAMLRQMVQARSLGLLDDDLTDQVPGPADLGSMAESTDAPTSHQPAQSADTSGTLPPRHDDPALQLQPNHAAGLEGPDRSAAEPGGATAPGPALHGPVPARGAAVPESPQSNG
jgi:hypothetical protein